jgi:hypothetical protein
VPDAGVNEVPDAGVSEVPLDVIDAGFVPEVLVTDPAVVLTTP